MYGNSSSEAINASVQSPSQPWIELNIDGVTQGAVAVDFTSGHPELVFKVSDGDLSKLRETHHEPGSPHGTTNFAVPLPVSMSDHDQQGTQTEIAQVNVPDKPSPPKKLLPFRWYGAKFSSLEFVTEHLPNKEVYIEPFSGSGTVLLNRKPASLEILNDIDTEVIHFFEVLRTKEEELLESIALTPFSREELERAVEITESPPADISDVELARLFFIKASQTRTGLAQQATAGRWAYCTSTSRRGMSGSVSRLWGRLKHLPAVADRLRRVQLESKDALELIEDHVDNENTLIYLDPPYPHETRTDTNAYKHEYSRSDHKELASLLMDAEADIAISGYECDLYEDLYETEGWHKVVGERKKLPSGEGKREAEVLWTNYDPEEVKGPDSSQKGLTEF